MSSSSFSWTSSTLSPILSAFFSLVFCKLLLNLYYFRISPFAFRKTSLFCLDAFWYIRWSVPMYPPTWSTWSWTSSTFSPMHLGLCSFLSKHFIKPFCLSPFSHSRTSILYLVLIWSIRWSVSMVLSTPPPIHSGFSSLVPCKLFIIQIII